MKVVFQSEILRCPRQPAEVDAWYRQISTKRKFLDVTEDKDLLRFRRCPECVGYRFQLQNPFSCVPGRSENVYIANFGVCFALPVLAFDMLPCGEDMPFQKILYQLLGSTPDFTETLKQIYRTHMQGSSGSAQTKRVVEKAVERRFASLPPEFFDCSNDAGLNERIHLWRWITSNQSYLWVLEKRPASWIRKQAEYHDEQAYAREICFLYFLQIYGTFLGQIMVRADKKFAFIASRNLDREDSVWRRCGARLHALLDLPWEYKPGEETIEMADLKATKTPEPEVEAPEDEKDGPKKFGRYELVKRIGGGGMADVYLAVDPAIGREVVIKSISSIALDSEEEQNWWTHFRDEAKVVGSLSHPNIVRIFDMGEHHGVPYIVMQYLDGESLDRMMERGYNFSIEEKVHIICQVASALGHAHEKRVVHRDVKPSNILILPGEVAVLTDFGIAAIRGHVEEVTKNPPGSIPYMPPEAFSGRIPGPQGDQFALAVTTFELFYGVHPFRGSSDVHTIHKITSEEPDFASVADPEILPDLEWILRRGVDKNPNERHADVLDFAEALRNSLAEAVQISEMSIINLDQRNESEAP